MTRPLLVSAMLVAFAAGCLGPPDANESGEPSEPYNNVLWASTLGEDSDVDIAVRELLFSPGWIAPKHYHNSDLFIYVLEGEFEVEMEGDAAVVYSAGQALEMRTEAVMNARNVSDVRPLKLVVFQVGQTEAPFVVPVRDAAP